MARLRRSRLSPPGLPGRGRKPAPRPEENLDARFLQGAPAPLEALRDVSVDQSVALLQDRVIVSGVVARRRDGTTPSPMHDRQ
ncbi:hypothetical protein FM076_18200 [Streptomyces albus subsp. chlorinus]|nr:hypothetical protein [Streptomyces albus subsp. chlorinus]